MALAGRFICSMSGIDSSGGFDMSLDAIVEGLGYAVPPIMALLFILDVCYPSIVYSSYGSIKRQVFLSKKSNFENYVWQNKLLSWSKLLSQS